VEESDAVAILKQQPPAIRQVVRAASGRSEPLPSARVERADGYAGVRPFPSGEHGAGEPAAIGGPRTWLELEALGKRGQRIGQPAPSSAELEKSRLRTVEECQSLSIRRAQRGHGRFPRGLRHLCQAASIRSDRPDLPAPASIRLEEDLLAVCAERWIAVSDGVVREFPMPSAVHADEEEILSRPR